MQVTLPIKGATRGEAERLDGAASRDVSEAVPMARWFEQEWAALSGSL